MTSTTTQSPSSHVVRNASLGLLSSIDRTAAADWLLRASFAGVFIFHGASKFMNLEGGAQMMGMSVFVWALVAAAELGGGIGILAGRGLPGRIGDALTRISGASIVPVMLGAIAMVHWGRWSFVPSESHPMGGMEFQVVLLAIGLAYALRGNKS